MSAREDCVLVAAIARQQQQALDHLYARYSTIVYRLALKVLQSHENAEEVVGEVFWQVWREAARYDAQRSSVRLAESSCSCGRPYALLDSIQGRVEDVLHFPAVGGGWVTVHPNLFHDILDLVPTGGWQVVQRSDGLKVLLSRVQEGYADEALAETVQRALAAHGAMVPPVKIEHVSAIPRGPAGKAALIKSEVPRA